MRVLPDQEGFVCFVLCPRLRVQLPGQHVVVRCVDREEAVDHDLAGFGDVWGPGENFEKRQMLVHILQRDLVQVVAVACHADGDEVSCATLVGQVASNFRGETLRQ